MDNGKIIPHVWAKVKVGELFSFVGGGTPSKKNPIFWNGDIPWASVKDIKGVYLTETQDKITELGVKHSSTNIAYPGDVILITRISPGKAITSKITVAINQDLKIVKPWYNANPDFIRYLFTSKEKDLINLSSGTTVLGVSLEILNNFEISFPPLNEQNRIVLKLDELFSELENGKEQLQTALEQLKVYRQAILKDAFEGRLTEEWRREQKKLKTPDELVDEIREYRRQQYEKQLKEYKAGKTKIKPKDPQEISLPSKSEIADRSELPKGWKYVVLSNIVENNSIKISPTKNSNLKFVGMDCIESHSLRPYKFHEFSEFKSAGNYFEKDRVLYGRMRPYLNKIWYTEFNGACSGEFLVLNPFPGLSPDFLKYKLHSSEFVTYAMQKISGDRPRISYDEVVSYVFPLCSFEEQTEIINIIELQLSNVGQTVNSINETLLQIDSLKQSILHKAFEGKLVDQDPNDEPASILLNRIKEEREKVVQAKNGVKKEMLLAGESEVQEFKESVRRDDIAKALCSFLNGKGGCVMVGVDANGTMKGIANAGKQVDDLKSFLLNAIVPEAPITISEEKYEGKDFIVLKVYSGSKQPYLFDGSIYFRNGASTVKATSIQISELIHGRQKSELHWERQSALGVDLADLDSKLILSSIKESRENRRSNFEGGDILEFLFHYGLYQNGSFTNACLVLFAKNPSRFLPQIRVRLTEYGEQKTGNTLLRDELFEGNLFSIQDKLERYIGNLGIRSVFDKNQWKRIDFKFPEKALQEGVINALMHRDYSSPSSGVAISIYPDSIVISNSGHLPDDLKVSELKKSHRSHPQNPDIAHIVFLRGLIDKLGKGTIKVVEECRREGLKDPAWTDNTDGVTLTFNGPKALAAKKEKSQHDGVSEGINDGVSEGVNRLIDDAVNDGLIDGVNDGLRIEIIRIVELIRIKEGLNALDIATRRGKSKPTIERYLRTAKEAGIIEFKGAPKTGGYYLTEKTRKLITK